MIGSIFVAACCFLTVLFATLNLAGVISWPVWVILFPLFVPFILWILVFIVLLLATVIVDRIDSK